MNYVSNMFEGKHKETLRWKIDKDTLYVSGTGKMPDANCGNNRADMPWANQKDLIQHIVIGEGITTIGIRNFEEYKMLETVVLPKSLEQIRYRAFYGCERLNRIETKENAIFHHVYDSQEKVDKDSVKRKCKGKNQEQIITFGRDAFYCSMWAVNEFGLFFIKDGVLYDCFKDEKSIVIPEGVFEINKFAFENKGIEKIKFPKTLEVIHAYAFSNTELQRLELSQNVKKIEYGAFRNCPLEVVIVGNREIDIDKRAFMGTRVFCNFKRTIPSAYELFNQSEREFAEFKRIIVREKRPYWTKNGKESRYLEKAVFGIQQIDVGRSIVRKLQAKSIVIGISYYDGKVRCVKSLRSLGDGLFEEYLMYPCIIGKKSVGIWRDSFTYQERKDILYAFPKNKHPEQLMTKRELRTMHQKEYEEWFWSNDRGNFGGLLEIELLEKWLIRHKEIKVQSMDENREEDRFRWFVEL